MASGATDGGNPSEWWFLAWLLLGGGWALAVLGAMTIGIFILPVVVGLTVLLARNPAARPARIALVSGLGLPLLYVAFLNRDGPGTVCTTSGGGTSCTDEWSPWPWLVAGLALVALGIALARRILRDAA